MKILCILLLLLGVSFVPCTITYSNIIQSCDIEVDYGNNYAYNQTTNTPKPSVLNSNTHSIVVKYTWERTMQEQLDFLHQFNKYHVKHIAQTNHVCNHRVLSHLSTATLLIEDIVISNCMNIAETISYKDNNGKPFTWNKYHYSIFREQLRDRHYLFIGDSVISGIYRTFKHMLIELCDGMEIIHINDKKRKQNEICQCHSLNTSVSYVAYVGGVISEEIRIDSLMKINTQKVNMSLALHLSKQMTHVLTGNMIWFYYPDAVPSAAFIVQNLTEFKTHMNKIFPRGELIFVLSPGIAEISPLTLGPIPTPGVPYAQWHVNRIVEKFALKQGHKVLHTSMIKNEMAAFLHGMDKSDNPVLTNQYANPNQQQQPKPNDNNILFVDNFHPCVPTVDIPFLLMFVAGTIKKFWN